MNNSSFTSNYFIDIFYVQNLHAVIYLIFCIFFLFCSLYVLYFIACCDIFACCFTLVCRNKSPTGLMLHVCEYSTKIKFLCLCLCLPTALKGPQFQFFFIYITDRSKAILLLWFHFVLCFGVELLYCLNLMYAFIFLFKFG